MDEYGCGLSGQALLEQKTMNSKFWSTPWSPALRFDWFLLRQWYNLWVGFDFIAELRADSFLPLFFSCFGQNSRPGFNSCLFFFRFIPGCRWCGSTPGEVLVKWAERLDFCSLFYFIFELYESTGPISRWICKRDLAQMNASHLFLDDLCGRSTSLQLVLQLFVLFPVQAEFQTCNWSKNDEGSRVLL